MSYLVYHGKMVQTNHKYGGSGNARQSWSSYWNTLNKWFALPSTGLGLMVGKQVTIYGDELMFIPIGNPLKVEYTCDIGAASGNNYVINPVAGNIGDHQLTIVFKNGGYTIQTKTITFTVYAAAPAVSKKILCIGDSLLDGGDIYYGPKIREVLAGSTITMLGTVGVDPNKNEGYGGAWYGDFVWWGPHDIFQKPAATLNIPAYFTDNSIDTPDYVFIALGVNDVFGSCNPTGDGLTDAELTVLINYAKSLIDGFLDFNADLKIILSPDPLCCNTLAGWLANYDPATRDQQLYMDVKHKWNQNFIATFANGVYNARVDCTYDFIYLDRNDGYPKTEGVHTNAVHPDQSGYEQIGQGMGIALNKRLAIDLMASFKPTVLTLGWENDYMTVDFTDNSGGICEHEIWESKDGGAYSLVTTLAAGTTHYHDSTWQNASMNYKVRAKDGVWFSDYSDVVNYATPLVFKTDQTSNVNVVFTNLNIQAGKTININWGDGTNNNYSGNNSSVTKTYTTQANPYYITISGDTDWITYIRFDNQVKAYGDLTKWNIPSKCTFFRLQSNSFSGSVTDWVIPSVCTAFNIYGCQFTGDLTNWVLPATLQSFYLTETGVYGYTGDITGWVLPSGLINIDMAGSNNEVVGDLSGWIIPITCTSLYMPNNNLTKLPRSAFQGINSTGMYFAGNSCNQAEIDTFLAAVDTYWSTHTPTKNGRYNVSGTGMGVPSAAGLASKASIEGKYTAAGYTATINVNS